MLVIISTIFTVMLRWFFNDELVELAINKELIKEEFVEC